MIKTQLGMPGRPAMKDVTTDHRQPTVRVPGNIQATNKRNSSKANYRLLLDVCTQQLQTDQLGVAAADSRGAHRVSPALFLRVLSSAQQGTDLSAELLYHQCRQASVVVSLSLYLSLAVASTPADSSTTPIH